MRMTHEVSSLLACCCAGFVTAVWEVFAAAHPWKGMTMGEEMTAVMIEGRRLIWGPGVPKVGWSAWSGRAAYCLTSESGSRLDR